MIDYETVFLLLLGMVIREIFVNRHEILMLVKYGRHNGPFLDLQIDGDDSLGFHKQYDEWIAFKKDHPEFLILINGVEVK